MFPNNTDNLIVFNEFGTQIGAGWQDFSYHSLAYRLAAETLIPVCSWLYAVGSQ